MNWYEERMKKRETYYIEGPEGEYLRPKAVTELLGIGKNTFYALANAGQLPAVRIGKQWRVRREDLERYFTATAGSFSD